MLRITGGEFRGRLIHTPNSDATRPTQARLRQALFNSIQTHIAGARVLDLFAGSGALGIEALSRGASQVIFVEQVRSVSLLIEKNLSELKVTDRASVWSEKVESALKKLETSRNQSPEAPFEIIFADPPYGKEWEQSLLRSTPWEKILAPGGLLLFEGGLLKGSATSLPETLGSLVKIREKIYGESVLTTYRHGNSP